MIKLLATTYKPTTIIEPTTTIIEFEAHIARKEPAGRKLGQQSSFETTTNLIDSSWESYHQLALDHHQVKNDKIPPSIQDNSRVLLGFTTGLQLCLGVIEK